MNIRRSLLSGIAALTLALPVAAYAQDGGKSILDLPAGQTVINLSTSERVEVDQDLLVAVLRIEAENKDPRALQNEINTLMKKAVDAAKATPDVKVTTQQYYVYPHDPAPPQPLPGKTEVQKEERIWRGNQSLEVKSTKADDLLALVGKMQDMGLVMNGLAYTLSPDKAESTRDGLMEAALEKLTAKATRAAKALGKTEANLLEVNVDAGGYYPQPMMMNAMADMGGARMEKMAAPVAAPGQTEITMTVSARALLKQ
ncbi:MAG: SIMPL domain-containing protein [Alphaproteobacteria bacterium]|nr:SIMPL domain-containing protein [Alphaproteobacteria bacterium]MBU0860137.1 SIMPL domain-containing protein [Alphaproteobacteria bacterium]